MFSDVQVRVNWRGYRHAKSDTLILLPRRELTAPVGMPELISVRRHLVEKAIVSEEEVDGLFAEAAGSGFLGKTIRQVASDAGP